MAYKYQPIKDEIFASDDEGEVEELEEGEEEVGETILGALEEAEAEVEKVTQLPPNSKVKQVIEQDGVLILETVEADPNDPEGLPEGSTILADGSLPEGSTILADGNDTTLETSMEDDSSMDDSAILAELEESNLDLKPVNGGDGPKESCHICGKKVAALDKHILSEHGEKVECQLCNQTFPVGNLRWHILKEHCHNKVDINIISVEHLNTFNIDFPQVTECSLCEQKFVTKNALKNHIKQVHLSETSTCHICHKEYKDLYHHVKYFHEKIRNYECSYCEKKFQAKKLLYNHVQSIHLGEKTRCPDCNKDISVDNFSRHVRETHERVGLHQSVLSPHLNLSLFRSRSPALTARRSSPCPICLDTSDKVGHTELRVSNILLIFVCLFSSQQ